MNGWTKSTGNMNRRIDICQSVEALDDSGSISVTFPTLFSTWADVRELRGKELVAQGAENAQMDATFLIRYREDYTLTRDMVVSYNGRIWEIISIAEVGHKDRFEIAAKVRRAA